MMKNNRTRISNDALDKSLDEIERKTEYRMMQKGPGAWQSTHEILGVVAEEYAELIEAIKDNNIEKIKQELLDVAVACNFGVACINEKTLDW